MHLFDWVLFLLLTSPNGFLLVPRVSGITLMVSLVEILLLDSWSGISTNSWTCIDAVCWDVKIRQQVNSSYMYSQFSHMFSLTSTEENLVLITDNIFLRKMLTCVHIITTLMKWFYIHSSVHYLSLPQARIWNLWTTEQLAQRVIYWLCHFNNKLVIVITKAAPAFFYFCWLKTIILNVIVWTKIWYFLLAISLILF